MVQQSGSLGKTIRNRRIELGLTQEELAERIGDGVRQSDVSRLERDRIQLPRAHRMQAIAQALEMEPGELLVKSGWNGAIFDRAARFSETPIGHRSPGTEREPGVQPDAEFAPLQDESPELHGRLHQALEESRRVREQTAEAMRRAREVAREWDQRYGVASSRLNKPSSSR